MNDKADQGEDHWRTSLSEEQFEITRRKGTEHPFNCINSLSLNLNKSSLG